MAKVVSTPDDVTAKPYTATGGISSFLMFSWRYLYCSYFAHKAIFVKHELINNKVDITEETKFISIPFLRCSYAMKAVTKRVGKNLTYTVKSDPIKVM